MKQDLFWKRRNAWNLYSRRVLDVFLEQGIHFDGNRTVVNGVSAGSTAWMLFVSGQ